MSEIKRLMEETDSELRATIYTTGNRREIQARLTAERAAWRAEVARLREENARLRAALGDDDAGRPFAELLHTAATCFSDGGGGPLGDCLRSKAYAVEAALETP